jgi:hypothetical protein
LLYIIHELLHVAETLDHAYFEPLFTKGEGDVHENIALPSTDDLWQAKSEDQWRCAATLQKTGLNSAPTQPTENLAVVEKRISDVDETWLLAEFPHLPELTRLILSVGPLYGAVRRCTYSAPLLNNTTSLS